MTALTELILAPGQQKKLIVNGRYIYVLKASGPVEVAAGDQLNIVVDVNDFFELNLNDTPQQALTFYNRLSGPNTLELMISNTRVHRKTSADLADAVVQIAADQRIGIDSSANNVNATIVNDTLTIAEVIAPLGIDPNQNVVVVGNLVGLDPNHNTVQLANPPQERPTEFRTLDKIVFDIGGGQFDIKTIQGNPDRKELHITYSPWADPAKTVWIGGEHKKGRLLRPGDHIVLNVTADLDIKGEVTGHEVYLGELVYV